MTIPLFSKWTIRATFRVFKIERKVHGREDLEFLERVFQKLLLNFTWWAIDLFLIPISFMTLAKVGQS